MYWIYLIIFSFGVFIPSVITEGVFGFSVVQTQEFAILLLGIVALTLFNIRDKKYKKGSVEKAKAMSQINRMSRDLTNSYSYIGEMNRKLDILENVTSSFPEDPNVSVKRERELYSTIISAIEMITKSKYFTLRFIDEKKDEALKELRSRSDSYVFFDKKKCPASGFFFEDEESIFVRSPKSIENIHSCVMIKKESSTQRVEDPEMLKALAMQALLIFIFTKNGKKIEVEKNNQII